MMPFSPRSLQTYTDQHCTKTQALHLVQASSALHLSWIQIKETWFLSVPSKWQALWPFTVGLKKVGLEEVNSKTKKVKHSCTFARRDGRNQCTPYFLIFFMTPVGLVCKLMLSANRRSIRLRQSHQVFVFFCCLGWQHPCSLGFSFCTRSPSLDRNSYIDLLGAERESWITTIRLLVHSWLCCLCELKAVIRL